MATDPNDFRPWLTEDEKVTATTDADNGGAWINYNAKIVQVGEPITGLKPHKCPVCEGRGEVAWNFYSDIKTINPEFTCRSCKGTGYLLIL